MTSVSGVQANKMPFFWQVFPPEMHPCPQSLEYNMYIYSMYIYYKCIYLKFLECICCFVLFTNIKKGIRLGYG